jgi:hypothetical protein
MLNDGNEYLFIKHNMYFVMEGGGKFCENFIIPLRGFWRYFRVRRHP